MDKSIEEKFIPYIDQELTKDEIIEVQEYLKNNEEANLRFNDLKKSRNFVQDAFNDFKVIDNDRYIDSLIENFPIKSLDSQVENLNFLQKIIKNFSLPNFASGALIAGCLGFFAIMSPLSLQNVALNKDADQTNEMMSIRSTTSQIEKILNKESSTSVSKKLNEIEEIIKKNRNSNNIIIRSSKNLSNKLKIKVIDSKTESNCIDIIINDTSGKITYTFCKKDNLWKNNK